MTRVVRFSENGGPEVMRVVDEPVPLVPPGSVLVDVRAIGVNPVDWKIRGGRGAPRVFDAPRGLGSDASGIVSQVGEGAVGAEGFQVGDEVIVHGARDAYATQLVAGPGQLTPKPAGLGWDKAAAIGIPIGTAYQVLRSLGLAKGETLLVHGGSGGVGQAAVQLGLAWGASVVATASAANLERIRELGGIAVEYGQGLLSRLREAAPQGYDLVLDAAGTDEAVETSLQLVADRSRIGTIVLIEQSRDLGIRAWSGSRPGWLTPDERALRAEAVGVVAALVAEGRFEIEIAARYPLDEVVAAHRHSETGHVRGKIVLVP